MCMSGNRCSGSVRFSDETGPESFDTYPDFNDHERTYKIHPGNKVKWSLKRGLRGKVTVRFFALTTIIPYVQQMATIPAYPL
jgi:hypothetical protein